MLAGCDIILHCNGNINEMKKIIGILKKMDESKNINTLEDNDPKTMHVKNTLELSIDNYEGPLELLLVLAKTQKVDLMQISIVQLVDQYISYVDKIKKNLEIAADFLVMASWLAYLKSRLLR